MARRLTDTELTKIAALRSELDAIAKAAGAWFISIESGGRTHIHYHWSQVPPPPDASPRDSEFHDDVCMEWDEGDALCIAWRTS